MRSREIARHAVELNPPAVSSRLGRAGIDFQVRLVRRGEVNVHGVTARVEWPLRAIRDQRTEESEP